MSMTIHVTLFRACRLPCAKQFIATASVAVHCNVDRVSSHEQRLPEKIRNAFQLCERRLAESLDRHQAECSAGKATSLSERRSGVPIRGNDSLAQNGQPPAATQRQINVLYGMT